MAREKSRLRSFETVTPELARKRQLRVEPIDFRGLMRRHHVEDQHEIDRMLLARKITVVQHAAAEAFMAVCSFSSPRSPALEFEIVARESPDAMASQWLAPSAALSVLRRKAPGSVDVLCELCGNGRRVPTGRMEDCLLGLDALSVYYGTSGVRDPRELVAR